MSDDSLIGPALPPGFKKPAAPASSDSDSDSTEPETAEASIDLYGPALPPNFKPTTSATSKEIIRGPTLPPGFKPSGSDSDDDDDYVIGPVPNTGNDDFSEGTRLQFEKRAEKMKRKLTNTDDDKTPQREEWMTSLPNTLTKAFGLGPRQFNRRTPIEGGDRSVWTDTPKDAAKKEQDPKMLEKKRNCSSPTPEELSIAARDAKLQEEINSYNDKKRTESLMDIHAKKLRKKMKAEAGKPKERRPFDRDVDLQANKFDNAQKEAVLKRSRELNDKFGAGKAKFL